MSIARDNKQMCCLICGQMQPKSYFLSHISEHLHYKQHQCQDCKFDSVTAEEMADHESNTGHMGQAIRHRYMDRVCRLIYNDCDYGEKNGGLEKVLKRKMVGANEEEANASGQTAVNNNPPPPLPVLATETTKTNAVEPQTNVGIFVGTSRSIKEEECIQSQKAASSIEQMPLPNLAIDQNHQQYSAANLQQHQWIGANSNATVESAVNHFPGMKMEGGGDYFNEPQQIVMPNGEILSEFPTAAEEANFLEQAMGSTSSSSTMDQQSALEKFIAEQQRQQHFGGTSGHQQMIYDGQQEELVDEEDEEEEGDSHLSAEQVDANVEFGIPSVGKSNPDRQVRMKKSGKEEFKNVKCLKCGQLVKGRGICLIYHINTRHLKLPMFRCLACPRDFYYVTDTTAKNHIRSFHGDDQSLLENNYQALSKTLHDSRREFFGITTRTRRDFKSAAKQRALVKKAAAKAKEITFRDRPQAGSNVAGNSSHAQCVQCGEYVATIYASQLGHMNTKHFHLAIYQCRICERPFESLGSSPVIMHIKSAHGKIKEEADAFIIDRRDQCLKQLNENYRKYFT